MQTGDLPSTDRWWEAEYLPTSPRISIDKGRDFRAELDGVKAGLETFKAYYGRRGRWWKKELTQAADEAVFIDKLATDRGISPDRIHQLAPNNSGEVDERDRKSRDEDDE